MAVGAEHAANLASAPDRSITLPDVLYLGNDANLGTVSYCNIGCSRSELSAFADRTALSGRFFR
jgi:hypothetical protein